MSHEDDGSDLDSLELDNVVSLDWVPRGVAAEKWWRRFSGARALAWAAMIPIAVFFGLIYSVAFVAICSLYANWASDMSAWRSDVNPQLDRIEARVISIVKRLDDLEERRAA